MLRYALAFLTAGALLFLNDRFAIESILVPSSSMLPTIEPNERLFLRHRWLGGLKRFDVVVVSSRHFKHRIIKRLVGMPGDCIQLKDSWQLVLNGRTLDYQRPADAAPGTSILSEEGHHLIQFEKNERFSFETKFARETLCLEQDEYFVLGDNRLASDDGRSSGPIRLEEIDGKAIGIWYSYDKKGARLRTERLLKPIL
ncbi:MAG: signal peptidase I [Oligoflexia bacterium]|nr:signal peptidase I [Oligoflexia bacterium]